jgi:hypothetical protein
MKAHSPQSVVVTGPKPARITGRNPAQACRPPRSVRGAERINLQLLLDALRQLDISLVIVSYSGGGDEGDTTGTTLFDLHGAELPAHGRHDGVAINLWRASTGVAKAKFRVERMALVGALEVFAYDTSVRLHGDWCNNEGADGEVHIDVVAGTALVKHDALYIASDHTEIFL